MLTILQGDAIEQLRTLPDESVHCCVTSPPYWGLRDYSTRGQLGLEKTPEEYVAKMVAVFREVRRVLRKDGTLWLNMGDSYGARGGDTHTGFNERWAGNGIDGKQTRTKDNFAKSEIRTNLKPKDLCGIPWHLAFALQADGWWLRSDIIWAKLNPMPESVTDRPTKAHEYIFLLTKSANYFYDAEAIKESAVYDGQNGGGRVFGGVNKAGGVPQDHRRGREWEGQFGGRNKRTVWTVATAPYPEAHFATYPPDLIKPCILAGTSAKGCCAKCGSPWERIVERIAEKDYSYQPIGIVGESDQRGRRNGSMGQSQFASTNQWKQGCRCFPHKSEGLPIPCTVLDPFGGSGTTGAVALELGRKAILIELNPKYVELIKTRCNVTPGLQLA